jgi:hypothetical protein
MINIQSTIRTDSSFELPISTDPSFDDYKVCYVKAIAEKQELGFK